MSYSKLRGYTAYAIRLYELLIAWRSTGKTPIIETQELRRKLGVLDGEYKMIADFKSEYLSHLSSK